MYLIYNYLSILFDVLQVVEENCISTYVIKQINGDEKKRICDQRKIKTAKISTYKLYIYTHF